MGGGGGVEERRGKRKRTRTLYCIKHLGCMYKEGGGCRGVVGGGGGDEQFNSRSDISFGKRSVKGTRWWEGGGGSNKVNDTFKKNKARKQTKLGGKNGQTLTQSPTKKTPSFNFQFVLTASRKVHKCRLG